VVHEVMKEKGEDDIRMVYDGTKSGLNDSIWVPSFPLPTVDTMLRAVTYDTVMSDFDIGDCFLNLVLHDTMQKLCGIDWTKFFGDGEVLWKLWEIEKIRPMPFGGTLLLLICLGQRLMIPVYRGSQTSTE